MQTGEAYTKTLPFKPGWASSDGGQLAGTVLNRLPQVLQSGHQVNTILHVGSHMVQTSAKFLMDSGASVSVILHVVLADCWRNSIGKKETQNTLAVNGLPLEVIEQVTVQMSLGKFRAEQKFTVVQKLTVDCILGVDFLVEYGAVIDCKASTLAVGMNPRFKVSISVARGETAALSSVVFEQSAVSLPNTIEIPACSLSQVVADVQVTCGQEGVIEPLGSTRTGVPKHILVGLKSNSNTTWFYKLRIQALPLQ